MLLRYADKRIVNIMKVYIERNNLFTLFTFNLAKRRIRPPNAQHGGSNINHFASISDSQCRLAAASELFSYIDK